MTIKLRLRPWDLWMAEQFPRADRTRVWTEMMIAEALRWSAFWLAQGLKMGAVVTLAMAAWRFGVDIQLTRNFPIAEGLWSHWQVWLAGSIATGLLAGQLRTWFERPARAGEESPVRWQQETTEPGLARAIAE